MNDNHPIIEGFEVVETGGGCTAQQRLFSNGAEILVTESDSPNHEATDDDYAVGVYFGNHERVWTRGPRWADEDAPDTLAAAVWLAVQYVASLRATA